MTVPLRSLCRERDRARRRVAAVTAGGALAAGALATTFGVALAASTRARPEVPAAVLTSMLRTRIALRGWRVVHRAGYACWPVGVLHGLGLGGADSTLGWVVGLNVACGLAVLAALAWRLRSAAYPDRERRVAVGGRRR